MFYKRHKKLCIFFIILALLSATGAAGYFIAKKEPRIVEIVNTPEASPALPAGANDEKIEDNATIKWDYEYKKCEHHIYVSCQIEKEMAGLTFSMFSEKYPDIKIIDFSTDNLVLKKTFDCYCPEHMILKKYKNELAVFRTSLGTDNQEIYIKIPIKFDNLDTDEKKVLSAGKVFNNRRDMEDYIEDIET